MIRYRKLASLCFYFCFVLVQNKSLRNVELEVEDTAELVEDDLVSSKPYQTELEVIPNATDRNDDQVEFSSRRSVFEDKAENSAEFNEEELKADKVDINSEESHANEVSSYSIEPEDDTIAVLDDEVATAVTPNPYTARYEAKANVVIAKLQENAARDSKYVKHTSNRTGGWERSSIEMNGDPLYLDYGVNREELEQPLLVGPDKALHYNVLVNTPHGRHLLMISLLEQLGSDTWETKCGGKLKIFLPDTLRSPYQPYPTQHACLLDNIVINGRVVMREEVMDKLDRLVPPEMNTEMFSWYKLKHRNVIHSVVDWVLEQETFGSSYSLLVTIKEKLDRRMFVELVNMVITGREDTGFIVPSMDSYMPEDFFIQESLAPLYGRSMNDEEDEEDDIDTEDDQVIEIEEGKVLERSRRQAFNWGGQQRWQPPMMSRWQTPAVPSRWQPPSRLQPPQVPSRWQPPAAPSRWQPPAAPSRWQPPAAPSRWQPRPPRQPQGGQPGGMVWSRSDPSEAEWYFREDPVANAHHGEWHRTGGRVGGRYGEHFYFMHGQMLARYEAERLSLRLGMTTTFGPWEWGQWIRDSYDPRLGWAWTPRPVGRINSGQMSWLLRGIRTQAWNTAPRSYSRGVDWGISSLGQRMEVEFHDAGHDAIAAMSGGSRGVMGSPIGAMRDPIFYRWHGFVESLFKEYKNRLPGYSEADLSFPGVTSVTATVQSQGGDVNTFYTYREMANVNMDSLDSPSPGSRMSMQYLRMNHSPFTWSIVVNSNLRVRAPAIVRVFMMPANGADNRATIHMDHFFMDLNPGENLISRDELEAPHLSKSRWSLSQLQNSLMNGQVGWRQFSWGGCGWPRHLNIPRGTEAGMAWNMVVMVSQVLPVDIPRIGGWAANRNLAWSYCGVRRGVVPDSRPLGFPTDRDFGDIRNLVRGRDNWAVVPVTIVHGTSN